MKRIILAVAICLAMTLPAQAEVKGVYAGIKFIDSIQSTGTTSRAANFGYFGIGSYAQNSVGGGIFAGYDFYPQVQVPIRVEVEYDLRTNMTTQWSGKKGSRTGSIDATWGMQTLFANVYWDFHNSSAFTPYIGAGLGMGFINNDYEISGRNGEQMSFSKFNTVFAWNAGVGCSYAFSENVSADLAYRFVGFGANEASYQGDKITTHPNANEFSLGLRFTF